MNRIRELRKQKGMTQKELASMLEVADSTLSYWEMGRYEPGYDYLWKLSRFFFVPIDYILGGDIEEWARGRDSVLYENSLEKQQTFADFFVKDANAPYGANPPGQLQRGRKDVPDGEPATEVVDLPAAFSRSEFAGLTTEEIEKLAEYAEFLKTRRSK